MQKSMVERSGAKGEVDKGATFFLTLTAKASSLAARTEAAKAAKAAG
jgi:hypothetical protein